MGDNIIDDDDELNNSWVVEIHENQRWSPVIGWSCDELQWSEGDPSSYQWPNGSSTTFPDQSPPLVYGWKYEDKSKWEIDLNVIGSDNNGWIYSDNFANLDQNNLLPVPHKDSRVRRRYHIRSVVEIAAILKEKKLDNSNLTLQLSYGNKKVCCNHCGTVLDL